MWGWAFLKLGSPWVAHLVCPIPILDSFKSFISVSKFFIFPEDFTIFILLSSNTAIPAESYPLYSKDFKPLIITLIAFFYLPIYPIIPHIITPSI